MSLYDLVMRQWVYDCVKHNLKPSSDEYAREQFNTLTPAEQLQLISDALEELL